MEIAGSKDMLVWIMKRYIRCNAMADISRTIIIPDSLPSHTSNNFPSGYSPRQILLNIKMRSSSFIALLFGSSALVSASSVTLNSPSLLHKRVLLARQSDANSAAFQECTEKTEAACPASATTYEEAQTCQQASCAASCRDLIPGLGQCCSESGGDPYAFENCLVRLANDYNKTATGEKIPTTFATANATAAPTTTGNSTAPATTTNRPSGASATTSSAGPTSTGAGERLGAGGAVQMGVAGTAFAWAMSLLLL
jgi:hypothetical protein